MKKCNLFKHITNDLSFMDKEKPIRFRMRAAGIIIKDGNVLFAHNNKSACYYSVGGAVEFSESVSDACEREVFEETGVHFKTDRLIFVHENFFWRDDEDLKNIACHEITFYFLMKPCDCQIIQEKKETLGMAEQIVWLPIDQLDQYDIYPVFFREKLKKLPEKTEYVTTKRKR